MLVSLGVLKSPTHSTHLIWFSVEYAAISLRRLLLADKGAFRKYCSGSANTGMVAFRLHFLEPCLQWLTLAYTLESFDLPEFDNSDFFNYLYISVSCIVSQRYLWYYIIPLNFSDRHKEFKDSIHNGSDIWQRLKKAYN